MSLQEEQFQESVRSVKASESVRSIKNEYDPSESPPRQRHEPGQRQFAVTDIEDSPPARLGASERRTQQATRGYVYGKDKNEESTSISTSTRRDVKIPPTLLAEDDVSPRISTKLEKKALYRAGSKTDTTSSSAERLLGEYNARDRHGNTFRPRTRRRDEENEQSYQENVGSDMARSSQDYSYRVQNEQHQQQNRDDVDHHFRTQFLDEPLGDSDNLLSAREAETTVSNDGKNEPHAEAGFVPASQTSFLRPTGNNVTSVDEFVAQRVLPYRQMVKAMKRKEEVLLREVEQLPCLRRLLEDAESRIDLLHDRCRETEQELAAACTRAEEAETQALERTSAVESRRAALLSELQALEERGREQQASQEQQLAQMRGLEEELAGHASLAEELETWRVQLGEELQRRLDLEDQHLQLETQMAKQVQEHREREIQAAAKRDGLAKQLAIEREKRNVTEEQADRLQYELKRKQAQIALYEDKVESCTRENETLKLNCEKMRELWEREAKHKMEVEERWVSSVREQMLRRTEECEANVQALQKENAELKQKLAAETERATELSSHGNSNFCDIFDATMKRSEQQEDYSGLLLLCRKLEAENADLRTQISCSLQAAEAFWKERDQQMQEKQTEMEETKREREEARASLMLLSKEEESLEMRNKQLKLRLAHLEQQLRAACSAAALTESLHDELTCLAQEKDQLSDAKEDLLRHLLEVTKEYREVVSTADTRVADVQRSLLQRNEEVRLLMLRIQELSSKYVPMRSDPTDVILARYIHAFRPAVPFTRLLSGVYHFGTKQVQIRVSNDRPVFRIGGGFLSFERFLETYSAEELDKILDNYNHDLLENH
ncbi:unnamed protein product [Amoebophrya sp. A25]|nr:unnamed protein product [Amoebophrya sp. A25]|eukprot:GSA25T00009478001.1